MPAPILHLGIENAVKETFAIHQAVGVFTTEVHLHSCHQLLYAERGVLHFFTRERQFILPARHAAWIPVNLSHKVESRSPSLHLRTIYVREGEAELNFPEQLTVFPLTDLAREMIIYTERWPHVNPLSKAEDAFFIAVSYLISDWCRNAISLVLPTTEHLLLRKVIGHLITNLDNDLTTASVSGEFGVSSRTMMRLFRNHLDMTFQEYLRTARVIAALELLTSPDVSITETAQQVGYQSMSSFSRTFKAYVGKSPSVFRNETRSLEA